MLGHDRTFVPPLPRVFAEFHRVLAPGGRLLLAFQAGYETDQRAYLLARKPAASAS